MSLSETEENYLKAVYYLHQANQQAVSTNDISARLSTSAASVSDMIKRLAEKKLLVYEKYKGVELSDKGAKVALHLIRKHRLWEVFLVDKLGFRWDEVHDLAEQLEHIKSPELVKRLDEYLEFPKFDPHGDPIPDEDGKFAKMAVQKMTVFQEGTTLVLMGVADTSDEFLQYLNQLGLSLGVSIRLGKKFHFDQSQEVFLNDTQKVVVSQHVANNLLVKEA